MSITIGTRVREVSSGRVGTVTGYVPGVDSRDATHCVDFDDHAVAWLPVGEITPDGDDSDGHDDSRRARARELARRALFDDVARSLTPHDLDVLGSSLTTSMVCGTGWRVQARKLARRGLVAVSEVHAPRSVLVAKATDLGREFHAWWVERARAVMGMKGAVQA